MELFPPNDESTTSLMVISVGALLSGVLEVTSRISRGEENAKIRWFAIFVAAFVFAFAIGLIVHAFTNSDIISIAAAALAGRYSRFIDEKVGKIIETTPKL